MDSYVGRKEKQHSVKTILVCGCRKYPPGIPGRCALPPLPVPDLVEAKRHRTVRHGDGGLAAACYGDGLICILGVAEEVIVIYLYLAILVAKLESQLHILTEGL